MAGGKQNVDSIFLAAIEIGSDVERQAYLEQACGGDAHMRSEAEQLLKIHFNPGNLVNQLAAMVDTAYLEEVGHSYWRHGRLNCLTGRLDEAVKNFNKSIEPFEKLIVEDPAHAPCYRIYKAAALGELSLVLDAQGRSQDAAEMVRRSAGLHDELRGDFPSPRSTEDRRNAVYALHRHALVRLYFGDSAGYRRTCEAMKAWLSTTDDRVSHYYLAWSCCLGAGALGDLTVPITHVQASLGRSPHDSEMLTALGVLFYREGRFDEAARRLSEAGGVLPTQRDAGGTVFYPRIFLAMAQQRLGHADDARRQLDEVRAELAQKPKADMLWDHRVTLDIFRREAESLIFSAP